MEAGSIWIRLGLIAEGFKRDLADTKVEMTKWRDETNASTKDWMKWGRAIAATAAPITAVGAAMYAGIQRYGGMAQELRKLSVETGKSVYELQRLEQAEKNLHGVPIYTDEQIKQFAQLKSDTDSAIARFDHLLGKAVLFISEFQGINYQVKSLDTEVKKLTPRLGDLGKMFETTSKKAKQMAEDLKSAKRAAEDLEQAIMDASLSSQGIGMEQKDLGDEYNALMQERRLVELQADPETSGGQAYVKRLAEIDRRLAEITLDMNVNNQSLTKNRRTITRAQEDIPIQINIINASGTPADIAFAVEQVIKKIGWSVTKDGWSPA